ncbi:MAG: DUF2551 domain-containing protein [Archaeoglobi archaeon]|nr:DUF2551 domain-containing protein [Candidatus Mnemosynella bozhongmuii]
MELSVKVRTRIEKYLKRDKSGLRRAILTIILKLRKFTTDLIYRMLAERKFRVSKKSVAAIIGAIESRLGILKSRRNLSTGVIVYELKSEYAEILMNVLQRFTAEV